MKNNVKNIMIRAWAIARAAAVEFGGKSREFFAAALKMAWQESKKNSCSPFIEAMNGLASKIDALSIVHPAPAKEEMKKIAQCLRGFAFDNFFESCKQRCMWDAGREDAPYGFSLKSSGALENNLVSEYASDMSNEAAFELFCRLFDDAYNVAGGVILIELVRRQNAAGIHKKLPMFDFDVARISVRDMRRAAKKREKFNGG